MGDPNLAAIPLSELEEMARRADAATPGPWRSYVERRDFWGGSSVIVTGKGTLSDPDVYVLGSNDADQDLVAMARDAIPRMIAAIRRCRGIVDGGDAVAEVQAEELDRIEALARLATPSPWVVVEHLSTGERVVRAGPPGETRQITISATDADAALICRVCEDVPRLVAELRAADRDLSIGERVRGFTQSVPLSATIENASGVEGTMGDPNLAAISPSELEEMARRAAAATPGPWRSYWEGRDFWGGSSLIVPDAGRYPDRDLCVLGSNAADQDLVAMARDAIPRMIAAIRRRRGIVGGGDRVADVDAEELDRIDALWRMATPAPWVVVELLATGERVVRAGSRDGDTRRIIVDATDADAEFICRVCEDVPHLVAELRRLTGVSREDSSSNGAG